MLTAGMANAVLCRFSFSDDWTGLQKMLVFTNGIETRDVMLDGDECYIPHEVLSIPRVKVRVGVYGTDGENVILPTIWANLGDVHDAPDPSGDGTTDPSLPIWGKILSDIGNLSDLLTKDKESIGAHDVYKKGEWAIQDGKFTKANQDTSYSLAEYSQAWDVEE